MLIPHVEPVEWPEIRGCRFAAAIRRGEPEGCAIGLLGLPFDGGVALNHGRVGAADGPRAFRAALAKYGGSFDLVRNATLGAGVCDVGNVRPALPEDHGGDIQAALHETHDRVTEAVSAMIRCGLVPVCIGGGHDLTFASVRAMLPHVGSPVGGINVDAHLDVREEIGSGMPYRRLIEGEFLDPDRFVEYGIGRFTSSAAHIEWVESAGASIVDIESALADGGGQPSLGDVFDVAFGPNGASHEARAPGFVSIDLDAIDGSQAPGVSAPNPMGLATSAVARIAHAAGRRQAVQLFDIMELCPPHDIDGRTARIAALLFLNFVAGFGERAR